ncbi:MAG: T9SS type A sorting domain-containing protein [Paludibacteraceae bacterium]|nr:T9SS type A sorting domain-containing protein [Paludibacteraceae bacterium]
MWNERAGAVANFRNPLLFTIAGSDLYKADYAYLYSPGFVMELGDSAVVKSGSDVTIVSGQILLGPGFHAEQGSTFHAIANNGSNSLTQTKTPTIQNETEYSTDIPNASGIRCSVFPNPTNENSQVMLELDRDYHTMSLSITDITGRSIYHLVSASPLERGVHYYQLPFSCLPNGVLFLTFYSGTEKCTVRIIK